MDLNREAVLEQLLTFEKRTSDNEAIPELLEKYLEYIAKTGDTLFPWHKVKPLIKKKVEITIEEFHKQNPGAPTTTPNVPTFNYEELKTEIVESVDSFYGAPFTIQRICELITLPNRHYKRTDKFMRGLEKNILVVSYVEPRGESPLNLHHNVLSSPYHHSFASSSGYIANGSSDSNNLYSGLLSSGAHHSKSGVPTGPAPLQQLDSFTTVFSSPPSTPLAVVSDMHPYDTASSSSSSSSGSSAESSPLGPADASPPPTGSNHYVNSNDGEGYGEEHPPPSDSVHELDDKVARSLPQSYIPPVAEANPGTNEEKTAEPQIEQEVFNEKPTDSQNENREEPPAVEKVEEASDNVESKALIDEPQAPIDQQPDIANETETAKRVKYEQNNVKSDETIPVVDKSEITDASKLPVLEESSFQQPDEGEKIVTETTSLLAETPTTTALVEAVEETLVVEESQLIAANIVADATKSPEIMDTEATEAPVCSMEGTNEEPQTAETRADQREMDSQMSNTDSEPMEED